MIEEALRAIGLSEGEIKVYLALLGLGETTTGPLVKAAGVSISKAYVILDRLAHKGLASHIIKGQVKYFTAAQPERLRDYLVEKQNAFAKLKEQVETVIPALHDKQQSITTAETAQVFDGLRGIQTARERTLSIMKKGYEMGIVGIARTPYDRLNAYFTEYHARRIKKGIRCNYIYNDYARDPFGKQSASYPLSEVKYLPEGMITHAWMEIYADTVTIGINHLKSFSVVIQNQDVADSFRTYAKLLWSLGRK